MIGFKTAVSLLALSLGLTLALGSCSSKTGQVLEDTKTTGHSLFSPVGGDGVQIYFFDSDNLVNEEGDNFVRTGPTKNNPVTGSKKIRAAESYLVKSGDVELLVDCGYQSGGYGDATVADSFKNNVARKIATLCGDGVLEYVFVTHGDMDHLASFGVSGGLLDMVAKGAEFTDLNDKAKTIKIQNLIDFDSPTVAVHSDESLENQLVNTDLYRNYRAFRDKLDETNYLPASALFSSAIKTNEGEIQSKDNKEFARPEAYKDKTDDELISESTGTSAAMELMDQYKKNADYQSNVARVKGKLKKEADRFYYSLPFNGAELRVLYNWFYDFGIRHSFDSKDRNNISLCFEIVKNEFKFASFGDLGGIGEEALLKYYAATDILKNVTCFKASHHGSTSNDENSEKLFETMRPKVVCIVGCAQSKIQEGAYDPKAAFVEQQFLDNLYEGLSDEDDKTVPSPYLLYTNISKGGTEESSYQRVYVSNPFYGDIRINYDQENTWISFGYKGNVEAYVSEDSNRNFEQDPDHKGKYYNFATRKDGRIVSFQNTDWFKAVNLKFGDK